MLTKAQYFSCKCHSFQKLHCFFVGLRKIAIYLPGKIRKKRMTGVYRNICYNCPKPVVRSLIGITNIIIRPTRRVGATIYPLLAAIFAEYRLMIKNPEARARLQAAKGRKGLSSKRDPASSGPPTIANDSTDDIMPSTSPLLL